jgi:hypothetical protein
MRITGMYSWFTTCTCVNADNNITRGVQGSGYKRYLNLHEGGGRRKEQEENGELKFTVA